MRKEQRTLFAAAAGILLLPFQSIAQLTVAPVNDLQAMVQGLAGAGVTIMDPVIECHLQGYGEFTYTGNAFDVSEGILLTTGLYTHATGPNHVANRLFQQHTPGDATLDIVTGRTTYDACRLEFDLIPSGDILSFDYVFASEEYNEWVGSQYNDVFGFFLSGPGVVPDAGINEKNIALIPGSDMPVTINDVNNGANAQYFTDNTGGQEIEYDGFTHGLKAVANVEPCQVYHLKLVVADASDRKFDSGVFIQKIRSTPIEMGSITAAGIPELVEGCNAGLVRFSRPIAEDFPITLTYFIEGDAINGEDLEPIGDPDDTGAYYITIPAGSDHADLALIPIDDGITEGTEILCILLGHPDCITTIGDTLIIPIVDALPAGIEPSNVTICSGESVQLTSTGGATYSWSPATGLSATNIADPVATPASMTTYTATISNGDCVRSVQRTVTVSQLDLSAVITKPLCNGQTNGAINLTASGGIAPYAFSWSGPNGASFNTEDLVNIGQGTYTVTVTDAHGCSRNSSFNVNAPAILSATINSPALTFGQNIACAGSSTGSIGLSISGGTAPYSIVWSGPNGFSSNSQNLNSLAAGTYIATITDQNGCNVQVTRTLTEPEPMIVSVENITHVLCHGSNTGSATAVITGGMPPYNYNWNSIPAQNTATAVDLSAGNRIVTITDTYGCQAIATVTIEQPATPLSASIVDIEPIEQCQNDPIAHGTITAEASGGTAPYSYSWNTVPEQLTTTADLNASGDHTVTITDANGCIATASANVPGSLMTSLQISYVEHVGCSGTSIGVAEVTTTGSEITSIEWNSTPPTTDPLLSNAPSGTYTAIAQHANGCESTIDVVISELAASPLSIEAPSNTTAVTCFGANDGSATLNASGGIPPYSFQCDGAILPGSSITGLAAGSHTITVSDQNGCTATGSFVIDGPTAQLEVNITSFTNELCSGSAQGTASAQAAGGTAPYTYEWNSTPQQSGPDATDLPQGTYTVTVTDAHGCTAFNDVTIGGPQYGMDGMIEDYAHVTCFGANDGFATVTVWGGSNSFTVTWNTVPPQTGFTATGLAPGMYAALVVDNNGCDLPKSIPIEIQGPTEQLSHQFEISDHNGFQVSCVGNSDGWIDITVSGGILPYNYAWRDEENNVIGLKDLSGLAAGTYYLNVIDGNGCSIHDTIVLNSPPPISLQMDPQIFPGGANVSCSGEDDGSIDLSINGGVAPYTVQWSNNQGFAATSEDIELLGAGIYDVLVTDANGCTAEGSIQLTAPAPIELSAMIPSINGYNISCAGGSDGTIDLYVTGGTTPMDFTWNNGSTDEDPIGLSAGIHEVIVLDANGCKAMASFQLNAPEPLVVNASAIIAANPCAGQAEGSITTTIAGGVGPYSIEWIGPDGFSSTDPDIGQLTSGTYTITVIDANNCTTTSTVQINDPAPLSIGITAATYNDGLHIQCHGDSTGSISATVTGGIQPYDLEWTLPDGSTAITNDLHNVPAGEYQLLVTDQKGCTTTASVVLTESAPIDVIVTLSDAGLGYNVSCAGNDGSITLQITGGTSEYAYDWIGPNGFGSIASDITGLIAGTYHLVVTDANGCTHSQNIDLNGPEPIEADFSITPNICPDGTDAGITANVAGGASPYQFEWSGPSGLTSDQTSIGSLIAGDYSLIVTDQLGCNASFTVEVQDPSPIISGSYVSFFGLYNLQCSGDSTGVIALDPSGGTAPYVIQVNGPNGFNSNSSSVDGLIAGNYSITITDVNGCTMDTLITLTEPSGTISATFNTSLYASGTNVSCYNGNDGWIEADVSGGIGPYEIFWRGPDSLVWNMSNIYDLPAGNYSYELVVVDANQCSFSTEITLTQPDTSIHVTSVTSDHNGYQVSCPDANDGSIDITASGGNGGFTYAWIGPAGPIGDQEDLSSLSPGTYFATITDMNGCVVDHTVQLIAPDALSIAFASVNITCNGANDGILQADIIGGAGTVSHSWTGNGISPDAGFELTDLSAGNYCLALTDENGCSFQDCHIIMEPQPIVTNAVITDAPCGAATGVIDLSVTGGSTPYAFEWNNGSTDEDLTNIPSGIYSVNITDASGCSLTNSMNVGGSPGIAASAVITDVQCAGGSTGAIDLTIDGGTSPFQIEWANGETSEDLASLPAGEHSVTITDAVGCVSQISFTVDGSDPIQLDTTLSHYGNGYNISSFNGNDGSILIEPIGGNAPYVFNWSDGNSSDYASGLTAGTYAIEVVDVNGCSAQITIELTAPDDLEMPTAYSPNGDGSNDVFFIRGLDAYPKNTFTVYNRWGNVVFDRLNYKNNWAGENSNGEKLADGTYFVILTVADGARVLQGYVDMRR